jgi:MraZ protein
VFRGSFEHLIDQKGRVSVPARFREIIQATGKAQVVITKCPLNPPPRLEAYPLPAWERFEEEFSRLNRFDPAVIHLEDFYNGNAQVCEIDNQGRILVPPTLREWAGLRKEIVLSGARDKFRVWSRDSWQQSQGDAQAAFKASPEMLARLNL